jgi:gluconolactonase
VLNAVENVLYLAVTRANCVWRVRLLPDGTATKVGVFVQLSGSLAGPDGLALDEEDGLAIAHAGYGVVWICDRPGDPVIAIRSPEGVYMTNVGYGGADLRDLYITESYGATMLRAWTCRADRCFRTFERRSEKTER